jgi:hypothetical protein
MRDSISDKRSQLLRYIRDLVVQEFSGGMGRARNTDPRAFWTSLAQDHAVLSKDVNKVRLYGPS